MGRLKQETLYDLRNEGNSLFMNVYKNEFIDELRDTLGWFERAAFDVAYPDYEGSMVPELSHSFASQYAAHHGNKLQTLEHFEQSLKNTMHKHGLDNYMQNAQEAMLSVIEHQRKVETARLEYINVMDSYHYDGSWREQFIALESLFLIMAIIICLSVCIMALWFKLSSNGAAQTQRKQGVKAVARTEL